MARLTYTLARILIPLLFIVAGAGKFMAIAGFAKVLEAKGLPVPDQIADWTGLPKFEALAYLVAGVELIGGLLLLFGLATRFAAVVLCLFTLGTIYVSHHFWTMDGAALDANMTQALKNLAICGGLLLLAVGGGGPVSLDARIRRRPEQI